MSSPLPVLGSGALGGAVDVPRHLIEVAFKGNRREFFIWEGEEPPRLRAAVVVEADRGEDLGIVHSAGELAALRCSGCAHGTGGATPEQRVLRAATTEEIARYEEVRAGDEGARRKAMERVNAHGLVMKLSDAEWRWDKRKLTLYFTAERRVDFRGLVRDLASAFRTRIELKQIGVRDEARRLSGVGRCGREYCSASWLPELRPVNLQTAKDQRLSLNPAQISGACGRLMCCLRYEHEFYVQSRKRFPKEGRTLVTSLGEERVIANDIFRDAVTLRGADGDLRVVPLAELKRDLEQAVYGPAVVVDRDDPPTIEDVADPELVEEETELPSIDRRSEPLRAAPEVHDPEDTRTTEAIRDERQARPEGGRRRGRRGGRRHRPGGRREGDQNGGGSTDGESGSGGSASPAG